MSSLTLRDGSMQLTARTSLFLSVRNVFNAPYLNMRLLPTGATAASTTSSFGTNYTFGIKGTF